MPYLWPDYYYVILVLPAMLLSLLAQVGVKVTYRRMSKIPNSRGLTGAMAAQMVLRHYGIYDVKIEQIGGTLSDHYDPGAKVIRLSPGVFSGSSIASVGIACHEAGHAAQHAQGYLPIKIRDKIVPIANIGSSAGIWLAIIGYFIDFGFLVNIGIILFASVVVFQLVTLPVEFNASSRALKVIDQTHLLVDDERKKARKMLSAAALTYVAALIVSIASLFRLILRFSRSRQD